jgi:hypothetical protein
VAFAKGGDERSTLEVSLFRLHGHNTLMRRQFEIIECHPLPVIFFTYAPELLERRMWIFTPNNGTFLPDDSMQFFYELTRQTNGLLITLVRSCAESGVRIAGDHL